MSTQPFALVPLAIKVRGEVVSSNVSAFRELVTAALAGINRDLKTDEDFGQADADAKMLKTAEETVTTAKAKALSDAESLHALLSQLDETSEEIRAVRLDLEKLVTKRKEEVKRELIETAMGKLVCEPRLRQSIYGNSVADAIKGKRTLESMKKSLDVTVTMHNALITKCREILDQFEGEHGNDMIRDRENLEVKRPDQVEAELRRRLDLKKAEEQRKQAEAETKKAREEVVEAQRPLAAAQAPATPPQPPAPSRRTISPLPDEEVTVPVTDESKEWEAFLAICRQCFVPLKAARAALVGASNMAKAHKFATALNAAWQEVSA